MSLQFFLLMNVILVSRLIFVFKDEPLRPSSLFYMIIIQAAGLFFYKMSLAWWALLILLITINILFNYLEIKWKRLNETRLLSLLVFVFILSIFFSQSVNLEFNSGIFSFFNSLSYYFVFLIPLAGINWLDFSIVLFGGLLVLNEINLVIRYFLKTFKIVADAMDQREYNAGRIIGILERIIIFIAVLNNELTAIGLILAAKGLTRFKELDVRKFAEYVLIGTLLSALLAVLIALLVNALLSL